MILKTYGKIFQSGIFFLWVVCPAYIWCKPRPGAGFKNCFKSFRPLTLLVKESQIKQVWSYGNEQMTNTNQFYSQTFQAQTARLTKPHDIKLD